jgi:AraC-like DNA-binding protein
MTGSYQISTAYLRTIVHADPKLLERIDTELATNLAAAMRDDFIDGSLVNELFEQVHQQGVASWADQYSAQMGVGNHGPLGFAALSAPDLKTAVEIFVEYVETRSSGVASRLEIHGDRYDLVLTNQTGSELAGRWLIESMFLVMQSLVETIMAHPLGQQTQIHFTHSRDDRGSAAENIYRVPCRFEQADNRLSLPASWMQVPSPLYDEHAYRSNLRKVRELKLRLSTDNKDVAYRVKTRLLNYFDHQTNNVIATQELPSLERLAEEFNVSPRTLIRKLARQNTTYRDILEEIRITQATRLLRETHLTAATIANKLGYREPANFSRAFKRWTGRTPAAWRRESGRSVDASSE